MTESFETLHAGNIVAFIGDIFQRRGADSYLGEAVTMSQHMLQAAALAEAEGASEELIAAALLHDIGHYTGEFPAEELMRGTDNHHDAAGAAVLERFFPPLVTECVRHHVAAKRYLCAVEPSYVDKLSEASVYTLNVQGGPMSAAEAAAFAQSPYLEAILATRYRDEGAKHAAVTPPPFAHYAPLLQRVVDRHLAAAA